MSPPKRATIIIRNVEQLPTLSETINSDTNTQELFLNFWSLHFPNQICTQKFLDLVQRHSSLQRVIISFSGFGLTFESASVLLQQEKFYLDFACLATLLRLSKTYEQIYTIRNWIIAGKFFVFNNEVNWDLEHLNLPDQQIQKILEAIETNESIKVISSNLHYYRHLPNNNLAKLFAQTKRLQLKIQFHRYDPELKVSLENMIDLQAQSTCRQLKKNRTLLIASIHQREVEIKQL